MIRSKGQGYFTTLVRDMDTSAMPDVEGALTGVVEPYSVDVNRTFRIR